MKFQFWSMPEDSRVGILLRGSSVQICLVVLNQGCCGSSQYNLPDRMLRLDSNTTLNQNYVLFITLVNITYQSGDQHLPSIHFWDSGLWQVLHIPLFLIFSHGRCFKLFSVQCFSSAYKPDQFLTKVSFFSNLPFCQSFKSLLLLLSLLFLLLLLLFSLSSSLLSKALL